MMKQLPTTPSILRPVSDSPALTLQQSGWLPIGWVGGTFRERFSLRHHRFYASKYGRSRRRARGSLEYHAPCSAMYVVVHVDSMGKETSSHIDDLLVRDILALHAHNVSVPQGSQTCHIGDHMRWITELDKNRNTDGCVKNSVYIAYQYTKIKSKSRKRTGISTHTRWRWLSSVDIWSISRWSTTKFTTSRLQVRLYFRNGVGQTNLWISSADIYAIG